MKRTALHLLTIPALIALAPRTFAADSLDDLQVKVQSLQQQIDSLKASSTTASAATSSSNGEMTYKGVHITLGGFLASETAWRNNNLASDLATPFAKIPFANSAAYGQSEFRGSERQSRFSLLAQGDVNDTTHLAGYYEIDFLGTGPTSNPNESNSFNPRTRNIYMTVDWDNPSLHLLAGQNWSLVTLNSKGITPRTEVIPATVDPQYEVGFQWARQWQTRLVKDWNKKYWLGLSLENSQTSGLGGTAASGTGNTYQLSPGSLFPSGNNLSLNGYPDVVLKFAADTDYGHYEIYDLSRNFQSRYGGATLATQTNKQSAWTSAIGAGALIPAIPKTLDVVVSGLMGKGIGRYGTASLSDVTYRADGGLQPLESVQYLLQAIWHANEKLDVYAAYGRESITSTVNGGAGYGDGIVASNAGCSTLGGTCAPNVKSVSEFNVGAWWSFYKGSAGIAKLGGQYSHTSLGTFADASGYAPTTGEDEIFTSLRYYPF